MFYVLAASQTHEQIKSDQIPKQKISDFSTLTELCVRVCVCVATVLQICKLEAVIFNFSELVAHGMWNQWADELVVPWKGL